ncbi:MAG TPA: FtsX-like permease family protein [Gammaproteobacteria bacterium]
MEFRPILSALMRNNTGPVLIALQIAITLAIVTNAAFIIQQRADKMNRDTGMDDQNLVFARSYGFGTNYDHMTTIREDLAALRAMPGVVDAAYMDAIPLSGSGSNSTFSPVPFTEGEDAAGDGNYYNVDEHGLNALGLTLEEGRWFTAAEINYRPNERYMPEAVVVTRAFADDVFGEGKPVVGELLYNSVNQTSRVIGVLDRMQGAWVNWDGLDRVVLFRRVDDPPMAGYAIRVEPGQRDRLVPEIEAKLQDINRNRVVTSVRTHAEYISNSYGNDSAMVQMLSGVSVLLVAVTALGIVGLAAFNVNQRRKQIGTRRALGARRADILRYFLVESLLISAIGIAAGTLLAFAMSWWLGTEFGLPKLDWRFVPPAMVGLLLIAQLAVLGPARRASGISPALATRSV